MQHLKIYIIHIRLISIWTHLILLLITKKVKIGSKLQANSEMQKDSAMIHQFLQTAMTMLLKSRPNEWVFIPEEEEPELNFTTMVICLYFKMRAKDVVVTATHQRNDRHPDLRYLWGHTILSISVTTSEIEIVLAMNHTQSTAVEEKNECAPSYNGPDITPSLLHYSYIEKLRETVMSDIVVLNNLKMNLKMKKVLTLS